MSGILYIVGTPIGNLRDISARALDILSSVDFIATEDTRVSVKLLARYDIRRPLVSYHRHNSREMGGQILSRIEAGESCALVTDAGMPAISDPGEELVRDARAAGVEVQVIPGPSAFVAALSLSGMPGGRFTFEGFLSTNKKNRREHLESLQDEERTMIFYEAPHKLPYTLADMASVLGERKVAIARELTKIHEEMVLTTLREAASRYAEEKPKGEIVLIVEGREKTAAPKMDLQRAVEIARRYMEEGLSASKAAKAAAEESGIKKGDIYKELMVC